MLISAGNGGILIDLSEGGLRFQAAGAIKDGQQIQLKFKLPGATAHNTIGAAACHVPAGAPTAQSGNWVPDPDAEFFRAVERELGRLPFIAEDLGMITPEVYALRDQFHLPGMRVLQFAFDGHTDNPHLPENYVANAVAYTGTHDNPTARSWFEDLPGEQRDKVWKYLKDRGSQSREASRAAG
jgi:4-alpha-glucanotransferase